MGSGGALELSKALDDALAPAAPAPILGTAATQGSGTAAAATEQGEQHQPTPKEEKEEEDAMDEEKRTINAAALAPEAKEAARAFLKRKGGGKAKAKL